MEYNIEGGRGTAKVEGCLNSLLLFKENIALKKELGIKDQENKNLRNEIEYLLSTPMAEGTVTTFMGKPLECWLSIEKENRYVELFCKENKILHDKLEKIKKIAKEYQSYNRSGFEDILQIIESEE